MEFDGHKKSLHEKVFIAAAEFLAREKDKFTSFGAMKCLRLLGYNIVYKVRGGSRETIKYYQETAVFWGFHNPFRKFLVLHKWEYKTQFLLFIIHQ